MARIELPVLPPRLYRYRSLARGDASIRNEINSIKQAYLHCSDFRNMNDVMEGFYGPTEGLAGAEEYRKLVEIIYLAKTGFGMACLTETNGNELMWAHYANNYKGICIEYDSQLLVEGLPARASIIRLAYGDAPPTIDKTDASNVKKAAMKILSHKKANWAYEREWRILGKMGPNRYRKRSCVKGIYFGSRTTKLCREALIDGLRNLDISFFDMKVDGYQHVFTAVETRKLVRNGRARA